MQRRSVLTTLVALLLAPLAALAKAAAPSTPTPPTIPRLNLTGRYLKLGVIFEVEGSDEHLLAFYNAYLAALWGPSTPKPFPGPYDIWHARHYIQNGKLLAYSASITPDGEVSSRDPYRIAVTTAIRQTGCIVGNELPTISIDTRHSHGPYRLMHEPREWERYLATSEFSPYVQRTPSDSLILGNLVSQPN